MNDLNSSNDRALITLPARALLPARRWLPAPLPRRVAVLTVAGVASAVGTFFLKRLGELIAEDVYRRIKHRPARSPRPAPALTPPAPEDELEAGAVQVRLVSLQRVVSGPYFQQRLRIRQGRFSLPPDAPDGER